MNAQKKQLLMVGILGVVLVGVLVFNFTRKPPGPASNLKGVDTSAIKNKTNAPTSGTASPPKASAASGALVVKDDKPDINTLLWNIREVDFDYRAKKMPRDVMEPLVGFTKGKPGGKNDKNAPSGPNRDPTMIEIMKKVVFGIIWNPTQPLAVVDDKLVYPGYKYDDGVVVESIEQNFVMFKYDDVPIQVDLREDPKENLKEQ